jgi:hypothetical protein
MRPFITTGVDQPRSGIGVFQRTFSVSLHVSGRPTGSEPSGDETCPLLNGPRNSGQSARAAGTNCETMTTTAIRVRYFMVSVVRCPSSVVNTTDD